MINALLTRHCVSGRRRKEASWRLVVKPVVSIAAIGHGDGFSGVIAVVLRSAVGYKVEQFRCGKNLRFSGPGASRILEQKAVMVGASFGRRSIGMGIALAAAVALASCAAKESETVYSSAGGASSSSVGSTGNSGGGVNITGTDRRDGAIAVNGYLWRASLDTTSFMPLSSADPFGGVIITDWYSPPETPRERFKLTVYILDRRLRADGIKVSVFRQMRVGPGQWVDSAVGSDTAAKLENAILTRARQLRMDAVEE